MGGRRAHGPKVEKDWSRKLNRNERRLARNSALAATTNVDMVSNRGHRFAEEISSLPIVLGDYSENGEKIDIEGRGLRRTKLSMLRRKVAERLVAAKNETAMLTTFNEVDMSKVIQMKNDYKNEFIKKFSTKLGFMSFFVKACVAALKNFPAINAEIQGDTIVYKNYYNISFAVGTDRGLVVPVLRSPDEMSFAEIEKNILSLGEKARDGKITIEDLQGGTFTITNGGIYGSMLSTPILNPPQSGVLGMHNIIERAVVRDGQIIIRPMMYLALSYDHRIVDGKEAVSFLKNIKDSLEEPQRLFLNV